MATRTLLAVTAVSLLSTGCNEHYLKSFDYDTTQVCNHDVRVEVIKPKIMLVLDKSGSMAVETWDDDADPSTENVTRWSSLYGVVDTLLSEQESRLDFGATLFPATDARSTEYDLACLMSDAPDVDVAELNRDAIMSVMPAADAVVEGGTPATAGIAVGLENLLSLETEDPRVMILVTDGAANCQEGTEEHDVASVYDGNLPGVVASAYDNHEVATYVVGIDIRDEMGDLPVANAYASLNEVALAGGAPREGDEAFYNVADAVELQDALRDIVGDLSCQVQLQDAPNPEETMIFRVAGEVQNEIGDCATQSGWHFADAMDTSIIEMCGASCDLFQETGEVAVEFLCE